MKKKWYAMSLSIVLCFLLILTACSGNASKSASEGSVSESSTSGKSGSSSDGKVYDLNFNISAGATHPFVTELAQPWADYVEEKTEGRVKIHVYPSAALGALTAAYDDMNGGVYDLGMVVAGYFEDTDLYPMSIADLPFAINDPRVATEVMTKFEEKYMNDVFGKGITFLSTGSTDSYQLFSKKPVETVEDVKNMKINEAKQGRIEVLKQWGVVPVSLPNTDVYESLQRGIIDGAIYTAVGGNSFKFYELAPYMTKINIGASSQTLGMSTATFEKLPEDIQKMFIEDFGPRFAEKLAELYTGSSDKAVADFAEYVKKDGGRVITPSEEEMKKFRAAAKPVWDNWVKGANDRGYPGDEMMKDFQNWLKEAGAEVTF
jgi:TRAP-type C4-dicarboxylate transport system substrate-binding protein